MTSATCRLVAKSESDLGRDVPLRVGMAMSTHGHHPAVSGGDVTWRELTHSAEPSARVVRIQAADLRDARHASAAMRAEAVEGAESASIFIDIEVMIDNDARSACSKLASLDSALTQPRRPSSLLYVGTARGLAGLLADIHSMDIADGVTLLPLTAPEGQQQILNEVLPLLKSA